MNPRIFVVALLALHVLFAVPAAARRNPSVGERVTLSVDNATLVGTRQAHLFLPLLERVSHVERREELSYPGLKGFRDWHSMVISGLESRLSSRVWLVSPAVAPALVERSLRECLAPNQKNPMWPAEVLSAAGVTIEVERRDEGIYLRFSKPVGPLPHLLAGCVLYSSLPTSSGPYLSTSTGVMTSRQDALRGPSSMSVVELRPTGSQADVVLRGAVEDDETIVTARFPDVVVLLQSKVEAQLDRFGFRDSSRNSSFRKSLGLPQLVDVFAEGRGAPTLQLLPPGLVPARKLRELPQKAMPLPLRLMPLGPDAPVVPVSLDGNDELLLGTMERLGVMARSQGVLLRRHRSFLKKEGWTLQRWRPRSADAGVALLDLVAQHPDLQGDEESSMLFQLLDEDSDKRLQAALMLEGRWIADGRVVPMLTAERWFALHPQLRKVRVRDDGIPILSDAYWEAP